MSFEYNGVVYRDLEPQVRYDAEQVQLLKQADVTINENLQTVNESLQTVNTEINGKLTKPTNPSAESAVTMLADGTVGTKLLSEIGGGGKLYLHNIKLVNNTIKTSPPPEKTVYEINITLLDRNVNEINTADKFIARFDNYIFRKVIVYGRYSSGDFSGESYNTLIHDLENTSKILALNGTSIVNSMSNLDPLGIRIDSSRHGWILKTFSGSTYTADNITYTDAVMEV